MEIRPKLPGSEGIDENTAIVLLQQKKSPVKRTVCSRAHAHTQHQHPLINADLVKYDHSKLTSPLAGGRLEGAPVSVTAKLRFPMKTHMIEDLVMQSQLQSPRSASTKIHSPTSPK
jgi:hypothetical protein